jgi:hypothetical protein
MAYYPLQQQNPYLVAPPMLHGYGQAPLQAMAQAAPPPGWVQQQAGLQNMVMEQMRGLAGAVTQELAQLFGVRLDRNEETAWLTLENPPVLIASGAVNSRQIMSVGQEADFVAVGLLAHVTDNAAPPVVTPNSLRLQLVDGSTNRQLMRAQIPVSFLSETVAGASAGSRPWFLPKPRIFSRNSNVIFLINNIAGADRRVDLAFFGYRIYDVGALDLTRSR